MNQDFSFLETQEAPKTRAGDVKALAHMVEMLQAKKNALDVTELRLKDLKEEIRRLEQSIIPEHLKSCGVDSISIPGIGKVSYKTEYRASVKDESWEAFKADLQDRGLGDLIKENAIVPKPSPETLALLEQNHVPMELKNTIQWNTLAKLAKECAQEGQPYPVGLDVYVFDQTVIK